STLFPYTTLFRSEEAAQDDRPADHPHRRRVRAVRIACAEHPAHDHLPRDRDCVEDEREEEEELERDLVCAELRVPDPRADGRGDEERRVERRSEEHTSELQSL